MDRLLEDSESRRFYFLRYLHFQNDWVKLSKIAEELSWSERSLKYDMEYFSKNTEDFQIESSIKGIRLVFADEKNFKNYASSVLENSLSYQLLEKIFFEEHYTVPELADQLYVSIGKLYALIKKINQQLASYAINIETTPCCIVGDEVNIRKFFYVYFYEKYHVLEWPYNPMLTEVFNKFISQIHAHYEYTEITYSDFNIIRLLLVVNLIRYRNNHLLSNKDRYFINDSAPSSELIEFQQVTQEILNNIDSDKKYFHYDLNANFFDNLLFPFHQVKIINSYQTLLANGLENHQTAKEVVFLNQKLEWLAKKYEIPLTNKENIIYHLYNSAYLKDFDPRAYFILYNSHSFFAQNIKQRFPQFLRDIETFICEYIDFIELDFNKNEIDYLIYILFIQWDQLLLHLENKFQKINVLILSDSHTSHSQMIQDMLRSSFNNDLSFDHFSNYMLTAQDVQKFDQYSFVIANYPVTTELPTDLIQVENIPTISDINKIKNKVNTILAQRQLHSIDDHTLDFNSTV